MSNLSWADLEEDDYDMFSPEAKKIFFQEWNEENIRLGIHKEEDKQTPNTAFITVTHRSNKGNKDKKVSWRKPMTNQKA